MQHKIKSNLKGESKPNKGVKMKRIIKTILNKQSWHNKIK